MSTTEQPGKKLSAGAIMAAFSALPFGPQIPIVLSGFSRQPHGTQYYCRVCSAPLKPGKPGRACPECYKLEKSGKSTVESPDSSC